jgi:hypothetical protein
MVSELDIWRAANLLVKRYGDDAGFVAAQRADKMLANGDVDGLTVWKSILRAIGELARLEPKETEWLN